MVSPFDPAFFTAQPARRKGNRIKVGVGERNAKAKLTEEQVRKIFADPRRGKARQEIAKEYGVTVETIKAIQDGYTWKHLNLTSK